MWPNNEVPIWLVLNFFNLTGLFLLRSGWNPQKCIIMVWKMLTSCQQRTTWELIKLIHSSILWSLPHQMPSKASWIQGGEVEDLQFHVHWKYPTDWLCVQIFYLTETSKLSRAWWPFRDGLDSHRDLGEARTWERHMDPSLPQFPVLSWRTAHGLVLVSWGQEWLNTGKILGK